MPTLLSSTSRLRQRLAHDSHPHALPGAILDRAGAVSEDRVAVWLAKQPRGRPRRIGEREAEGLVFGDGGLRRRRGKETEEGKQDESKAAHGAIVSQVHADRACRELSLAKIL